MGPTAIETNMSKMFTRTGRPHHCNHTCHAPVRNPRNSSHIPTFTIFSISFPIWAGSANCSAQGMPRDLQNRVRSTWPRGGTRHGDTMRHGCLDVRSCWVAETRQSIFHATSQAFPLLRGQRPPHVFFNVLLMFSMCS